MKKYKIEILETLSKVVEVEANSSEEAEQKVEERWNNSEYVLGGDDFAEAKFQDIEKPAEEADKISLVWSIEDVKSLDSTLTDEECREVLRNFERHHEGSMEQMWLDLRYHIDCLKEEKESEDVKD